MSQFLSPDPDVRNRVFAGYPLLGRFFSAHPVALGLTLSFAAIVGMMIPSWAIGIHSFSSPKTTRLFGQGGFLWSGWVLNFGLGLPLIFGTLAGVSRALARGVNAMVARPSQVIQANTGSPQFWNALSPRLASTRRPLLAIVTLCTVACTLIDNGDLWVSYATGTFDQPDRLNAWDAGVYNPAVHFPRPVSKSAVLAFNVVSLLAFQGAAIFLGFFFAFHFATFLYVFSRLLFDDPRFCFRPMWHDLDHRLGLRRLGGAFTLFMAAAVLYETGVFLKRVELSYNNGNAEPFVLWLTRVLDSSTSADAFAALFTIERYQFDTLDHGALIALAVMVIPIGIAGYFPCQLYRRCIAPQRSRLADAMRAYDDDVSAGNRQAAKQFKRDYRAAQRADSWPNGTTTASAMFAVMGLVLLATWFPPIIAYGIVTGAVVVVAKAVWSKGVA